MLRYLTAGESHGKCLIAVLEGMVAGLRIDTALINDELRRRQAGRGRGKRMSMESDKANCLSGLRNGVTIGSPIAIMIENRDFSIDRLPAVLCPRPGHADLCGSLKYNFNDARNALERSSARETAARVAVGAVCRIFLSKFDIRVKSRIAMIGGIWGGGGDAEGKLVIERIDTARKKGDTLGGIFEVVSTGIPAGLGSFSFADRRLDGRIAGSLMSIQAIKGVELGLGFRAAEEYGSGVHDAIYHDTKKGFYRKTNNAGGIEGGVSNGEPIVFRCAMKPISTLARPLDSVNMRTKSPAKASVERSDVCAVESAAVVAEAVLSFELAAAMLEKFGGDSLGETKRNFDGYIKQIKRF
ncbi:MAG: chorismate synthase [Candidatus Omnitrophica bacterium]|nr:chorismate synthase [Candidatus Omnitrophota bacterium]